MGFSGASLAQTVRKLMDSNRSTYKGSANNAGSVLNPNNHPKHSGLDKETIKEMLRPTRRYGVKSQTKAEKIAAFFGKAFLWGVLAVLLHSCFFNKNG